MLGKVAITDGKSPSYICDLVREGHERRERLVHALIEGEESGPSDRSVRDIVAKARGTFTS
jgi:hypothetical protein